MEKLYCLTEAKDSITCAKRDFSRVMSYLDVDIKINKFYLDNSLSYLCFPLLKMNQMAHIARDYGLLNLCRFLHKLFNKLSVNVFKIGICLK